MACRRARPICCRSPISTWSSPCRAEIAPIAYQNKAVVYDLLFRTAAETLLTIAADPKHLGAAHRHHRRAPHLGLGDDPEPSLMMPGIIISCIFNEQGKLIFRAAPLQD